MSALVNDAEKLAISFWQQFVTYSGLRVIFNAWTASSDLTLSILNAPGEEADKWTDQWKNHAQSELQFVALTVGSTQSDLFFYLAVL